MNNSELAKELESKIDVKQLIENALKKVETLLLDGFIKEAEVIVKQLLRVDADNTAAMQLYGLIHQKNNNFKDAISILNKAIKFDDTNSQNYNNIALCYMHDHEMDQAKESILKAIELNPLDHNYLCNYGLIQRASGNNLDSIDVYKKAIELNDSDPRVWESMGSALGQEKRYDEAIVCFEKSLSLNPKDLGAHVNLAYAYHLTGQWEKAWGEYEYRLEYWHSAGRNPGRFLNLYKKEKNWDGQASLINKKIVIYCEQGIGDMIQFVRFIPKLKELGADVYIDTPSSLVSVFSNFATTIQSNSSEGYDYHCSILSLPYLLNMKTPDKFLPEPYVFIDEKVDMSDYQDTFNIGICWAGNPGHPNDGNRSCHLSNFRELAKLEGVKLFSLQKELGKRIYTSMPGLEIDLINGCEDINMIDVSEFMIDYKETGKILNGLDLVITVDTSLLHLSGAMGIKTYALIAHNPDWRWTSEGENTVWYNSVELFRQKEPGNWQDVFDRIKEKVKHESLL